MKTIKKELPTAYDCYTHLIELKKALNIGPEIEINKLLMLELVKKQNTEEMYLIKYLVEHITKCPQIIKAQNNKIIKAYNKPEIFKSVIEETENLFKTHPKFCKYAQTIAKDLVLDDPYQIYIINSIFFELCFEIISINIPLNPNNIFLNFHLLQYWLKKQKKIKTENLIPLEQLIINFLSQGRTPEEVITCYPIPLTEDLELNILNTIYNILPKKFKTNTICQVMAINFGA